MVYMMSAAIEKGLATRLERLTGTEAACCLDEFQGLGRTAQRRPEFRSALARARALADPRRLTALSLLKARPEMCACELQAALGVSHATVSHHMHRLVDAGLVASRREGKWAYYRILPRAGVEVP